MANIRQYKRAGYPAIALETLEPDRIAKDLRVLYPDRSIFTIAATGGLRQLPIADNPAAAPASVDPTATYPKAFAAFAQQEKAFLIVLDFQHIIANAGAYRPLLDSLPAIKSRASMILLLAPLWTMPAELQHEIPVLHDDLPTAEELSPALEVVLAATQRTITDTERAELLRAARGLTLSAAENAFALADADGLLPSTVEAEKMRLVKSRALTIEQPADPSTLGGLRLFKDYLSREVLPSLDLPSALAVRGLLLVGIPGTGKSLASKMLAAVLRRPLVRLDISAAKGSLVGESESTLRNALKTVDAVSPCVLWIDEIEKGLAGHASSAKSDGGTTLGMVGTLLTWLQEHDSPVIVIATCNDFQALPDALTRAGRFDERFFVDLPSPAEREEIAAIHLHRFGLTDLDILPARAAAATDQFTGAEIEQVVKSAMRQTAGHPTTASLQLAAADVRPIARNSNIQELRQWAKEYMRPANISTDQPAITQQRRID